MPTTSRHQGWFAPKLAASLEQTGTSVRELSRRLNGGDPESARRSIHRYLVGRVPSLATRQRIAEALGIDPAQLEPDADDEEDDAAVLRLIAHKLIDRRQEDLAAVLLEHVRTLTSQSRSEVTP